ncbi:MAG: class I SAM-dependent methyltransferase [Candidatus Heimdallarchaeaceae archaeon]
MNVISEQIGHILIIRSKGNLKDLKRFAEEQLSKKKYIRTVLLQTNKVSNEERVPSLRYFMGEKKFDTIHREYGCKFYLNPAKVFFSPRLSFERQRIASKVQENEKIINFFSGVGPFSICIARKKPSSVIHSIELNPVAYQYMIKNIEANKCKNNVIPYLGDAFEIVKKQFINYADRIILPLPMLADRALSLAIKALSDEKGTIHWQISEYIGKKDNKNDIEKIAKERLEKVVRENSLTNKISIQFTRKIRSLSPNIAHIAVDLTVN